MKSHEHNSNHESDNFATLVREAVAGEALPASDPTLREALLKRLDQPAVEPALKTSVSDRRRTFFQRAGIALASTAALALVGVIWQRPALERAIGMNTRSAVQSEELRERELSNLVHAKKSRPGQGLGAGRGAGDRPESGADTSVYQSRVTGEPKPGEVVQSGSRQFSSVQNPAIQETNPGFQNDGSTVSNGEGRLEGNPTQDYGSRVWPKLKKRYGEGGPPMSSAPSGTQPGNSPAPAPVVTGVTPAAQPAGPGLPAGSTPATESSSGYGGIAGRPLSGPESRFAEQGESKPSPHPFAIPEPKPAPIPPATRLPASAGEPGKYYEATDKRLEGIKREVDHLQTYKETLKQTEDKTADAPAVVAATSAPAKGPDAVAGEQKNEVRDLAEIKDRWMMAKLKEAEVREKLSGDELARRAKTLEDQVQTEGQGYFFRAQVGGEQYARIIENQFLIPNTEDTALSTFAIDVDTASYANVRRFLTSGQLPPPDAVRLEELVNYFKYKYPQPKGDDPFSVSTEMADCPWQPGHKLLRVGVQGKEIHRQERPASNIVFLIDTSGSMTDQNKLPLLKQAFTMLVGELNENDKVTMVTYAGNAGLKLPPTRGHEKETIIAAIDSLQSGGSTHGSAGISLAYEVAAAQFIKGGTNKVILATDGDLNVGITDDAQLVDLITKKAKTGVYLTVLGVGTGNLKDAKMERLANNGNGIYAYLDTVKEARKVLVEEMSGSLVTIAKDVKIQLEFNPNYVHSYRLLGYENRVMANQDFRNDAKDAGEIGAGHSVTAMYEVVLADAGKRAPEVKAEAKPAGEPLEFQRFETEKSVLTEAGKSDKLLNVRLRYKTPEATEKDAAKELKFPVTDKGGSFNSASKDFQFASSVVAFGLALRGSEYRGSANYSAVAEIAASTVGEDVGGHRAEFIDLVKRAKTLRGE